jgi:methyl-accepting chemotaxis protein
VNGISGTIATAVEEQDATTNEMSRNVSEAAHGSGEITSNIARVAAAESTSPGAGDTQSWWRPRPNFDAWSSSSKSMRAGTV